MTHLAKNPPKIKILQYMHGVFEYYPWSEWINRRYCERHGYSYVVRHDEPRRDRHVVWQKIPVIIDELCDCDYLLFVDADAVFYSHELRIENELIPELHGKSILMAADCGKESLRWNPGLPNSGVILVKNEKRVREFFAAWDNVSKIDMETRWQWPPTQLALWRHIIQNFKDDMRIVLDYYMVQGCFGQFIRHFCLYSDEERTNAMKAIYKRLSKKSEVWDQNSGVGSLQIESVPHPFPIMTPKSKIKVVQYHWGDQNYSYLLSRQINEAYCRRYGYEFVVKTFPPRDDRAWRWSKIPAMREELHDCDFLLYLDADAFFYSHELRIEDELLPLLGDKQIMMSADHICEQYRHQSDKPNTGVIFVRNTEKSAEILRIWDESSERPGLEEFRFGAHHEKDTCFRTIWQEYADDVKLLTDYYLMNGLYGIFIRHFMGMKDEDRLNGFKTFLENRREMSLIFVELQKLIS